MNTPRHENPLYDRRLGAVSEKDLHKQKGGADALTRQKIDFELAHRTLQRRPRHGANEPDQ